MEHIYQNIEGWFNYETIYRQAVAQAQDGYHFVEVGAWKGKSTSFMAVEIANSGKRIRFDVVDTWHGSKEHLTGGNYVDPDAVSGRLFEVFTRNLKPVESYYNPKPMTSLQAAATYADNSLDFVMIDASHEYEDVRADILSWLPKVRVGGVLAGDDFHYHWPGVIRAVQELLPNVQLVDGVTWMYQKR